MRLKLLSIGVSLVIMSVTFPVYIFTGMVSLHTMVVLELLNAMSIVYDLWIMKKKGMI